MVNKFNMIVYPLNNNSLQQVFWQTMINCTSIKYLICSTQTQGNDTAVAPLTFKKAAKQH